MFYLVFDLIGGGPSYKMKPIYWEIYDKILGQDNPAAPGNMIEVHTQVLFMIH